MHVGGDNSLSTLDGVEYICSEINIRRTGRVGVASVCYCWLFVVVSCEQLRGQTRSPP